MTTLTEGRHPGEFIMSEAPGQRSRDAVSVPESTTIEPNQVIAKKAVPADVVAAVDTVAGKGALTLASPAVSSKVKDGAYSVVCIEPATDAGTFEVRDPNGKKVGTATVGVAFDGEIKFTIADGGSDFAAGDTFTVTVKADAVDFVWVPFDQDGTDGSEVPAGIAIYGVETGAGETARIAAMLRDMEANGNCVVWPDDITAAEKADGEQALAALGIIVRY